MKFIADIFDKSRPLFENDGKLAKWHPLFEATESFFFILFISIPTLEI